MSSIADQHKSAELVLNVRSPDHWKVVLKDSYYAIVSYPLGPGPEALFYPRTYSGYCVIGKLPVPPLHHLKSVVVRVQAPVVLQGGGGPEDDLRVEGQRSHRVALLQPVTRHLAPKTFRDAGGDGKGVVLIVLLPEGRRNSSRLGSRLRDQKELPQTIVGTKTVRLTELVQTALQSNRYLDL